MPKNIAISNHCLVKYSKYYKYNYQLQMISHLLWQAIIDVCLIHSCY